MITKIIMIIKIKEKKFLKNLEIKWQLVEQEE